MEHILEAISIPFALACLAFTMERSMHVRRKADRVFFVMACVACGLMALAQSSWYVQLLAGMKYDTDINNYTWAIFNLLVLVSYTYKSWISRNR